MSSKPLSSENVDKHQESNAFFKGEAFEISFASWPACMEMACSIYKSGCEKRLCIGYASVHGVGQRAVKSKVIHKVPAPTLKLGD